MPTQTGPIIIEVDDAVNNGATTILSVKHTTTGTPASGIGAVLEFQLENSSNTAVVGADLIGILTDVTNGSEKGALLLRTRTGGSLSERWRVRDDGLLEANGAQTIRTSTGDLTLATAEGNGNIILSPNGSGKVGIGTTNPSYKLEILEGSAVNQQLILRNGGTYHTGLIGTSASNPLADNNAWGVFGGPNTYLTGISNAAMIVGGAGVPGIGIRFTSSNLNAGTGNTVLYATNTGKVAIGNTTPRARLDLGTTLGAGNGVLIGDYLELNERELVNNAFSIGFNAVIATGDNGTYVPVYSPGTGMVLAMSGGGLADLDFFGRSWGGSSTPVNLNSFVPVMHLSVGGNIGMGTTTPGYPLHLIRAAPGGQDFLALENSSGSAVTTKFAGLILRGWSTGSAVKDAAYLRAYPEGVDYDSALLSFWTRASNAVAERWQITSAGVLQAVGGAQTLRTNTGDLTLATAGGNGNIILSPQGTGKVTIGETAPTNLFHISNSACAGVDLIAAENASSGDCVTKFAGYAMRGRDTGTGRFDTGYVRAYPGQSDYSTSRLSLWSRSSNAAMTERTAIGAVKNVSSNNAPLSLFEIALAAGQMAGGIIFATIECSNGTDYQALTQTISFVSVNKVGPSSAVATTSNYPVTSSGTLTATWAVTNGTNKITMQVTPTSSFGSFSIYRITYSVFNHSPQALTFL